MPSAKRRADWSIPALKRQVADLDGTQARIALLAIVEGKCVRDALAIAETYRGVPWTGK